MRQVLTLLLLLVFGINNAFAGVSSHMARFSGGTTNAPPLDAKGYISTEPQDHFNFTWQPGKNKPIGSFPEGVFSLPYADITSITYGDKKHLRIAQTIALTALAGVGGLLLLLSKSHTHYLVIEYHDPSQQAQVINFEIGKDAIRPLVDSLELRTGKKVLYEAPSNKHP